MPSKTEIDGSILEQVKQFNYLGCELSLDGEPDFEKNKNKNSNNNNINNNNNKQIPRNMRHY